MQPLPLDISVDARRKRLNGDAPSFPPEQCHGPRITYAANSITPGRVVVRDTNQVQQTIPYNLEDNPIVPESFTGEMKLYNMDSTALTPELYSKYINMKRGTRAEMTAKACFGGSPNAARHVQPTGALAVLMGLIKRLAERSWLFQLDSEILRLILVFCAEPVHLRVLYFQRLPDFGRYDQAAWNASFSTLAPHRGPTVGFATMTQVLRKCTAGDYGPSLKMARNRFLAIFRWQAQVIEELQAHWGRGETTVHVWGGELAWGRKTCFGLIRDAMRKQTFESLSANHDLLASAIPQQRAHMLYLDSIWPKQLLKRLLPILVTRIQENQCSNNIVFVLDIPKEHRPGFPSDHQASAIDTCAICAETMWLNLYVALVLIRMYGTEPYSVVITNGALDSAQVKRMVAKVFSTRYTFNGSHTPTFYLPQRDRASYEDDINDTEAKRRRSFSEWWGYEMDGVFGTYALEHQKFEKSLMTFDEKILDKRDKYAEKFVEHHDAILNDPKRDPRTEVHAALFIYQSQSQVQCLPNST